MLQGRKTGILLHITSLPSKYGIGTLGEETINFINWMKKTNFRVWQILPLVPTNYGDSPYQSVSSTALNYYLIDFDILFNKNLLRKKDYIYQSYGGNKKRVDYRLLFKEKIKILRIAFSNFNKNDKKFINFVEKGKYKSFGVFMTIKAFHNYSSWELWNEGYRIYNEKLEDIVIKNFNDDYLFWIWTQYEFLEEWNIIHNYAKKNGIEIIGDIPLYVAYDSVEVWKNPSIFVLNENKKKLLVSGNPPDNEYPTGQIWGNPIYNWDYQKKDNYKWWNERIQDSLKLFDMVRLDHFAGFNKVYAVKQDALDATFGIFLDGPGYDFFKDKLDLPIIAEDLGANEECEKLLEKTKYPGMKVLEYAFDGNTNNRNKPSNFSTNSVVYTGTHDNMPLYQYITDLSDSKKNIFINDLKSECNKLNISFNVRGTKSLVYKVIELAIASNAAYAIIPMQDLLCQGKDARMNLPSTISSMNWSYRILNKELTIELSNKIKELIKKYRRN